MKANSDRGALLAATLPALAATPAAPADAKLRQLWSEYLTHADAYAVARERYEPARAAFDAEFPPCPDGVQPDDHRLAHDWLWRKHNLDVLWGACNAATSAIRATIATILHTKAEGLLGIGVKLAAMPPNPNEWTFEDYEDAVVAALEDIDRLIGSGFAANVVKSDQSDDDSPDTLGSATA
jgi:hypothetical protein